MQPDWLYVVCARNIPLGVFTTRGDALASVDMTGRFADYGELATLYDSEDHTIVGNEVYEVVIQKVRFAGVTAGPLLR